MLTMEKRGRKGKRREEKVEREEETSANQIFVALCDRTEQEYFSESHLFKGTKIICEGINNCPLYIRNII